MTECHVHHLAVTIPQWTSHRELPDLINRLFGITGIDPDTIRQTKGRAGYPTLYALKTETNAELISIKTADHRTASNSRNTTSVVVHGAALDSGNIDVPHVAHEVLALGGWCSEIHLAVDDYGGVLDFEDIIRASRKDAFEDRITTNCCRSFFDKKQGIRRSQFPIYYEQEGRTVAFPGKSLQIICYDRRGFIRVETRLRNVAAASDVLRRIDAGESVHALALGTLANNLTVHVPGQRRKSRKPATDYWAAFLGGTGPIRLEKRRDTANRSPWYQPRTKAQMLEKRTASMVLAPSATDQDDKEMLEVLQAQVKTLETRIRDKELAAKLEEFTVSYDTDLPFIADLSFDTPQKPTLVNRITNLLGDYRPPAPVDYSEEITF